LAVGLTILVGLAAAAPASALTYFKDRAFFNATISGTYVAHGTQTKSDCYSTDANGQTSQLTVTTTGDETLHFKSTRPVRLEVDRFLGNEVEAGTLNRRTPVLVTTTRTLVNSAPCHEGDEQPTCGTRTMHFGISLISGASPLRLLYDISDGQPIFPDDPFDYACSVPNATWWGKLSSPGARMDPAKLFNKRLRTFTVHAALGKSRSTSTPSLTAQGRYDLSFAVTLVRARH
jgi:hypothetical protein